MAFLVRYTGFHSLFVLQGNWMDGVGVMQLAYIGYLTFRRPDARPGAIGDRPRKTRIWRRKTTPSSFPQFKIRQADRASVCGVAQPGMV